MKIYSCLPLALLLSAPLVKNTATVVYKPTIALADTTKLPGKVLNLTDWKLTIPISTKPTGAADDIKQPQLNTYTSEFFFTDKTNTAVTFKASVDGATTKGSNFPRSELREMINNGKDQASWSSASGTHTLFIDQRVIHLPEVRDQIVIGQIHDANEYIIFYRLEGKKLLVSVNHGENKILDSNYKLGTRFNVKFVVSNNETKCYYNGDLKYTYAGSFSGAYFKAGAYVQSSNRGKKKTEGELATAYGAVEIFNTWVKHE
jgi:hypothetical protein